MGHNGLAILVPVLGRPHRVKPLLESIEASTTVPYRVLFLVSPHDALEVEAIHREEAQLWAVSGNYAVKIRQGIEVTWEDLLFFAADDLEFQPGWFEAAKAHIDKGAQVVGINDLIQRKLRPQHATHFLVTRDYARRDTIDGHPGPLFDGYVHWYCDDEFIATAKHRDVYAYAEDAHVKHLHPLNGTAEDDDTYRLGRQRRRDDRRQFMGRKQLWTSPSR
jgi:glycosyltransferase involved in cell wall biosynthesis